MELGKHLVAEFELEASRDTLAKWLAHHVAELIVDAERGRDGKTRKEASDRAVDTILKIWQHRAIVPGNANPLAPYRNILQILSELNPASNYWAAHRGSHRLAALYRLFLRLYRTLLLRELPQTGKGSSKSRETVRKFLAPEEGQIMILIQRLGVDGEADGKECQEPGDEFAKLQDLAEKLVDEMIGHLRTLRDPSSASAKRSKIKEGH